MSEQIFIPTEGNTYPLNGLPEPLTSHKIDDMLSYIDVVPNRRAIIRGLAGISLGFILAMSSGSNHASLIAGSPIVAEANVSVQTQNVVACFDDKIQSSRDIVAVDDISGVNVVDNLSGIGCVIADVTSDGKKALNLFASSVVDQNPIVTAQQTVIDPSDFPVNGNVGFAQTFGFKGRGTQSALIDRGVDYDSPYIESNLNQVGTCISSDSPPLNYRSGCKDGDGNIVTEFTGFHAGASFPDDPEGTHGTSVADTIVNRAPDGMIYSYVMHTLTDGEPVGTALDVVRAMNDIVERDVHVQVVNLSLGSKPTRNCDDVYPPYNHALEALYNSGRIVNVAAGNGRDVTWPGCIEKQANQQNVITDHVMLHTTGPTVDVSFPLSGASSWSTGAVTGLFQTAFSIHAPTPGPDERPLDIVDDLIRTGVPITATSHIVMLDLRPQVKRIARIKEIYIPMLSTP